MHPLLQPTRTQRAVNRALDTAGGIFAALALLAVLGLLGRALVAVL